MRNNKILIATLLSVSLSTLTGVVTANSHMEGYNSSVEYSQYRGEKSPYKLRISDLMGTHLKNADGDNIGKIDDLIIARNDNKLMAIVSVGGFLGMGDRLVAVPYEDLRIGTDEKAFYLNATKTDLEAKPEFKYNEGERTGIMMIKERKRYTAEVEEYLNQTTQEIKQNVQEAKQEVKSAAATTIAAVSDTAKSFKNSVSYTEVRDSESPYHLRMSEIVGEDVKNAADKKIGHVDDLIMSREDDSLMAIISVGGFLGMGDRLVSVPYKDLRMSTDGNDVYLDSTQAVLKAKPEFQYNEGEVFGRNTLQNRMNADK
ncbi:PRC-barrel domain-containing protein [Leucothrix arctica]|uniref:PRC-barrel domain-containing protein n=1 Tax=Leucothrix arctica TaxID=1481894 RepID=A0A317C697_9GAMM|nr:PRC-barrel domain-containing protein [Leucothrix arctica]PWQ93827.1 hypothetical protein DKT75_19690 [Leucothrix arctica]